MRPRYAAALALAIATLVALPISADAAWPGANGSIVYSAPTGSNGQMQIYAVDGSDQSILTPQLRGDATQPTISPDGRHIVYSRQRTDADNGNIWIMRADGSFRDRLTRGPAFDTQPTFSPDGQRILFHRDSTTRPLSAFFTMNLNGKGLRKVRDGFGSASYFPNGQKILFTGSRCAQCLVDLYTTNADGSDPVFLTDTPRIQELSPTISPDGSLIAHLGWFTIKADGTGRTRLPIPKATGVAFSPNGQRVAFLEMVDPGETVALVSANLDGSDQRTLMPEIPSTWGLDWGPRPVPLP